MMAGPRTRPRIRAPDATRERILHAAFAEIHLRGFQAASVDAILERAGVTKGALYHHFPDKASLGRAVVDEVIRGPVLEAYLARLAQQPDDPIGALQAVVRRRADDFESGGVQLGCPLNNLAQEMSPLDERFRRRIAAVLDAWADGIAAALERGQATGAVRRDVDARRVAAFVVAAIEGSFGMAKAAQRVTALRANLDVLADFLETLRPTSGRTESPSSRRS